MEPNSLHLSSDPLPPARRYVGVWVGIITVLVVSATLFFETRLTAAPADQTVMTASLMMLSCFVMYTSLFDTGRQKATETDTYKTVWNTYRTARDQAHSRLGELEQFCAAYAGEELKRAQSECLSRAGLTPTDFTLWQSGNMPPDAFRALKRQKKRALKRTAKLKPLRLHATMLLTNNRHPRRTPTLSARPAYVKRTLTALIPTFVGSLVTVAVTLEGAALTPAAIVAGILRIFTIVWCGVRGFTAGTYAVTEDDTTVLETKTAYLTAFLSAHHRDK